LITAGRKEPHEQTRLALDSFALLSLLIKGDEAIDLIFLIIRNSSREIRDTIQPFNKSPGIGIHRLTFHFNDDTTSECKLGIERKTPS
jgi:hypothetical protein